MRKLVLSIFLLALAATVLTANNDKTPVRVKGVVLYNRAAPAIQALAVTHYRSICGEQVPNETLRIHKKGGLQNVLAFLANIVPEPLPPLELGLEMRDCRFQPHVLALGIGSQLTIRNQDRLLHHVHARLHEFTSGWDNTSTLQIFKQQAETHFNFAFPEKGDTARIKMDKPGLLRLRSDAGQEWMSGYILVMPHRYFAITDAEGKFELPELPPERYDLVLWHETLGVKRQIIEIKAGEKNEFIVKWFPEEAIGKTDTTKANE